MTVLIKKKNSSTQRGAYRKWFHKSREQKHISIFVCIQSCPVDTRICVYFAFVSSQQQKHQQHRTKKRERARSTRLQNIRVSGQFSNFSMVFSSFFTYTPFTLLCRSFGNIRIRVIVFYRIRFFFLSYWWWWWCHCSNIQSPVMHRKPKSNKVEADLHLNTKYCVLYGVGTVNAKTNVVYICYAGRGLELVGRLHIP